MYAENYVELANLSKELLVSRRQIEWKVSLAFWGGIIAMVGFMISQGKTRASLGWIYWMLFVFLFIAGGIFTYWHVALNGSNRKDLDLIKYFRERAEAELDKNIPTPKRSTEELTNLTAFEYAMKSEKYFNCFFPHALITLLILICSMIVLA
jgi:phosphotransferase system  glucose/maltose/N-acetylglucosamine-specific IIC component